jgi:hypothetical protein
MNTPMPGINITLDVVLTRHRQLLREAETARLISSASHGKSQRRIRHGVGRAILSLGLRLLGGRQAVEMVDIRRADSLEAGEGRPVLLMVTQDGASPSIDDCKLVTCV